MTAPEQPLPAAITASQPPDNALRVGTVSSLSPLTVNMQGGSVVEPGVIGYTFGFTVGQTVVLGRQDQSWAILGPSQAPAASLQLAGVSRIGAVSATIASGTPAVVSNFFTQPFVKKYDATVLEAHATFGCFSTVANTGVSIDLQIAYPDGFTLIPAPSMKMFLNPAGTHLYTSGHQIITGPAGNYSVSFVWVRSSGTGTLTCDGNDQQSYTVKELF